MTCQIARYHRLGLRISFTFFPSHELLENRGRKNRKTIPLSLWRLFAAMARDVRAGIVLIDGPATATWGAKALYRFCSEAAFVHSGTFLL